MILKPARIPGRQQAHPPALLGLEVRPGAQRLLRPPLRLPNLLPVDSPLYMRDHPKARLDRLDVRDGIPPKQKGPRPKP